MQGPVDQFNIRLGADLTALERELGRATQLTRAFANDISRGMTAVEVIDPARVGQQAREAGATVARNLTSAAETEAKARSAGLARTVVNVPAFGEAGQEAGRAFATEMEEEVKRADPLTPQLDRMGARIGSMLGAMAAAFATREMTRMAAEWQQIETRIRSATDSTREMERVQTRLQVIARSTNLTVGGAAEQFQQTNRRLQELGFTTSQVLNSVEALGLALAAGGADAEQSSAAMDAWSRAMLKGAIDTRQFLALQQNAPRVVQALGQALGKTQSELAAMAAAGQLTARVVMPAVTSQMEAFRQEVERTPTQITKAFQNLRAEMVAFVGQTNSSIGATQILAQGVNALARNFESVAIAAATVGAVVASRMLAPFLAQVAAATARTLLFARSLSTLNLTARATAASMTLLSRSMAFFGGPLGLAITAVGAAFLVFQRNSQRAADELARFRAEAERMDRVDLGRQIAETSVRLAEAQREVTRLVSMGALAGAHQHQRQVVNRLRAEYEELLDIARELNALEVRSAPTQSEIQGAEVQRLASLIRLQGASNNERARALEIIQASRAELAALTGEDIASQTRRIELLERVSALQSALSRGVETRPLAGLRQEVQELIQQYQSLERGGLSLTETTEALEAAHRRVSDVLAQEGLGLEAQKAVASDLLREIEATFDVTERLIRRIQILSQQGAPPANLLSSLQQRYDEVTRAIEAQGGAHRADIALLERQLMLADRLGDAYAAFMREVSRLADTVGKGLDLDFGAPIVTPLDRIREAAKELADAQAQMRVGLLGGSEDEIRAAAASVEEATGRVREAQRAMAEEIARSNMPIEDQAALLGIMDRIFRELGISAKDLESSISGTTSKLRQFATAGRGILGVAGGLLQIDQNARLAADGVINLIDSLGQLRDARREAEAARLSGEAVDSMAEITALIGAAGAIASMASGVIGVLTQASEREQERKRVTEDNIRALNEVRDSLDGFRNTIGQISGVADTLDAGLARRLAEFTAGMFRGLGTPRELVDFLRILDDAGLSFRELQRIAEANGIQLLDKNGRIVSESFLHLNDMLQLTRERLMTFGTSFDERRQQQDARNRIFQVDVTPLVQFQQSIDLLGQFSPDFARLFDNIDVSTADGRALARQILQRIYTSAEQGMEGEFAEFLKDSDFAAVGELVDSVLGASDALDEFDESVREAMGAMLNVPQGFRMALRAFESELAAGPTPAASIGGTSAQPTIYTDPTERQKLRGGDVYEFHGPIYIDARDKPAEEIYDIVVGEGRRRAHATAGSLSGPMLM